MSEAKKPEMKISSSAREIIRTTNTYLNSTFPKGAINRIDENGKFHAPVLQEQFSQDVAIFVDRVLPVLKLYTLEKRLQFTLTGFPSETVEDVMIRQQAARWKVEEVARIGLAKKYKAATCSEFARVGFDYIRKNFTENIACISISNPEDDLDAYHDLLIIGLTSETEEDFLKQKKFDQLPDHVLIYDPWNKVDFYPAKDLERYLYELARAQEKGIFKGLDISTKDKYKIGILYKHIAAVSPSATAGPSAALSPSAAAGPSVWWNTLITKHGKKQNAKNSTDKNKIKLEIISQIIPQLIFDISAIHSADLTFKKALDLLEIYEKDMIAPSAAFLKLKEELAARANVSARVAPGSAATVGAGIAAIATAVAAANVDTHTVAVTATSGHKR